MISIVLVCNAGILCSGCQASFPEVKQRRCGVDHPPLCSADVEERVALYFYSFPGLCGVFWGELYVYRLAILLPPNVGGVSCSYRKALWPGLCRLEESGSEYWTSWEASIPVIPASVGLLSVSSVATNIAWNTVLVRHCVEEPDVTGTWPYDFGRHYSRFGQNLTDRACVERR
jgi:hypothetical protein